MAQPINLSSENVYAITIRGAIEASWLADFRAVDIQTEADADGAGQTTIARIVTDQAGLVGLIRRLHGWGVVLVAVRQMPAAVDS